MRYAAWRHGTLLAVLALLGPRSGPLMTARGEINRDVSSPNSDFHALHDLPALEPSKAQSLIRHMATPQGSHGGAGTDTDADMFVGTDTDTVIALYNQHQRRAVHEKLASGIRESPELEKVVMLLQTEINHLTGRAYWTATQAGAFVSAIDSGVSQHLSRALGAHAEHMAAAGVNPVVLLDADVRQVYSQQATERSGGKHGVPSSTERPTSAPAESCCGHRHDRELACLGVLYHGTIHNDGAGHHYAPHVGLPAVNAPGTQWRPSRTSQ
ncbi:hypothetical protein CXG81DRAFT_18457 [Caulochytrium protostelioides]|uniref:Inhibitor I9 domain-containing protein n=1 Tax=Caulochytrium protostelioides TaxID=1555241 RepID=A0A4P9X8W5_9FUNG|nr:hypothetical protein CXG81DRAFT_18457 [Caulochytrium protostelioides]|eukprot:RKP01763.1 hypothetical protein CXG81DRAFT_18457 [Caulochytrium protostelioides]